MSADPYIADFLKQHDRDRYLSTLVLEGDKRDAVQALYAFSADVAAIPARVTEPGPGEIRLQWWTDALEGHGHGNVNQNPIAAALLKAVDDYALQTGPLVRLIAARRFDLYQDPMPDIETFEGYAGETNSVLFQYAATILGEGAALDDGDAAGHLGVAYALAGHLRAFGYNAAHGRIYLPWSIFAANGVNEQQIFAGQETDGVRAAITQIADIAEGHLAAARRAIAQSPKQVRPAFALTPVIGKRLKRAAKTSLTAAPQADPDWLNILRIAFWTMRNG
ncbi:phytoene/squalene synthase family protein [Mariluticola halotolerans]|uniref:phytoene/squalene synthase family protein n=1 Tax=Mariluticola halotolerans TaxID=2909283 RepID=UPI0026E3EF38|nr:phytoene/squalene synthase family protein [Mariluticola halotolerans]UJQ95057.1 squalene/phytoene synthase family protein [Mariluticola halotolerans]